MNNDIAAAGRHWRTACQWPCCAMDCYCPLHGHTGIGSRDYKWDYNSCFAESKSMRYTRSLSSASKKCVCYATINLIVKHTGVNGEVLCWYYESRNELYTAVSLTSDQKLLYLSVS